MSQNVGCEQVRLELMAALDGEAPPTATTAAENTSGCSEPLTYLEDSTAPTTQIDSSPPALTNSAAASFSFSGSDTVSNSMKNPGSCTMWLCVPQG